MLRHDLSGGALLLTELAALLLLASLERLHSGIAKGWGRGRQQQKDEKEHASRGLGGALHRIWMVRQQLGTTQTAARHRPLTRPSRERRCRNQPCYGSGHLASLAIWTRTTPALHPAGPHDAHLAHTEPAFGLNRPAKDCRNDSPLADDSTIGNCP